jgi:hypothetical protein
MLSEDDRNLREMTDEELARAWDLWFDLAQSTNDSDPPYTHGVFVPPRRPSRSDAEDLRVPPQSQLRRRAHVAE